MALDDPATTALRRQIIASKPFLRAIYDEWYQMIAAHLPEVPGRVLELGSGAGYLNRFIPGLISSEVLFVPGISLVADARRLSFRDASLSTTVIFRRKGSGAAAKRETPSPRVLSETRGCACVLETTDHTQR